MSDITQLLAEHFATRQAILELFGVAGWASSDVLARKALVDYRSLYWRLDNGDYPDLAYSPTRDFDWCHYFSIDHDKHGWMFTYLDCTLFILDDSYTDGTYFGIFDNNKRVVQIEPPPTGERS